MKINQKIHSDDPKRDATLCGNWGEGKEAVYYRVPIWLFEKVIFSLIKEENKKSLCSNCVKEFLYLHWIKGEKKKGSIFPWVDCSKVGHFEDALRYATGPVKAKKEPK